MFFRRSMHKCVIFKAKTVLKEIWAPQTGKPAPRPWTRKKPAMWHEGLGMGAYRWEGADHLRYSLKSELRTGWPISYEDEGDTKSKTSLIFKVVEMGDVEGVTGVHEFPWTVTVIQSNEGHGLRPGAQRRRGQDRTESREGARERRDLRRRASQERGRREPGQERHRRYWVRKIRMNS